MADIKDIKEKIEKENKKAGVSIEEKEQYRKSLQSIIEHIENVRENGKDLTNALIDEGEFDLARRLLQRVFSHDVDKLSLLFFNSINSTDKTAQKLAIEHHRNINPHHLSYHNDDVKQMSDLDIAEWCVDIVARSQEFCTNLKDYVKDFAAKRNISTNSHFYKQSSYYFSLIVDKPFKEI